MAVQGMAHFRPCDAVQQECSFVILLIVVLGVFIWFNEMPVPSVVKGWNVREVCVGVSTLFHVDQS